MYAYANANAMHKVKTEFSYIGKVAQVFFFFFSICGQRNGSSLWYPESKLIDWLNMCWALHRVYMGWVHVGKEIPNQTVRSTAQCLLLRLWGNLMPVMGLGSETLCYDGLLTPFFGGGRRRREAIYCSRVDDVSTKEMRIKILQNWQLVVSWLPSFLLHFNSK